MLDKQLKDPVRVLNLLGASFSHGWFYYGCVVVVLGFWSSLVFTVLSGCLGALAVLCMLVVRRRRALVLQGLKRGFIQPAATAAGTNQQQQQEQQQQKKKTDNSNVDEIAAQNLLSISSLAPAQNKAWPPGAARMFEGSDIFFQDVTLDELWEFYFSFPAASSSRNSNDYHAWLEFIVQNLLNILGDITDLTGGLIDSFHCFAATSCLALVVLGVPDLTALDAASKRTHSSMDDHNLHKYFPTAAHGAFGICVVAAIFYALSPHGLVIDLVKVKVRALAAVVVLLLVCGAMRHFPSNDEIFNSFYAEPQTESQRFLDKLESENLNIFRLAKRPLANPTACLRPTSTSAAAASSNSSAKKSKSKKQNQNDVAATAAAAAEVLDEENEHVVIGDYVPLRQQWLIASICVLFSFFGDIAALRRDPLLPLGSATGGGESASFAPAVLMKDSVSFFFSKYASLIALRVAAALLFGVVCTLVSPMMSWEISFSSWLGVMYMKGRGDSTAGAASRLGIFDFALVVAVLLAAITFTSQTPLKMWARVTTNERSFYRRYPWLKHVVLVFVACLLAANEATFAMSAAAVRGKGERVHQEQQHQDSSTAPFVGKSIFSVGGLMHALHDFYSTISFGRNPWSLVSTLHYALGGTRCFLAPLMLYSRSEAALEQLGVPRSMISVNGEALLLDRGRAMLLGLGMSAAWVAYILSL